MTKGDHERQIFLSTPHMNNGFFFLLTIKYRIFFYIKTRGPEAPDLLNNVKTGQGQLRLIVETYFVLPYMGVAAILANWPKTI